MSGPPETLRTAVDTWQCDYNNHLNVQFYFGFFDEAAAFFAVAEDRAPVEHATRHVRYHAELASGDAVSVTSERIGDHAVVHRLWAADTGRLSATALDTFGAGLDGVPEEAAPRSLPAVPAGPDAMGDRLAEGRAVVSCMSVVEAGHCDARGMTDRWHIARFSSAAPTMWAFAGFGKDVQRERGLGTVAVEMKLTPIRRPRPGDLLVNVTAPVAHARKTVTFRHALVDRRTGAVAAMGEVTALLMDLKARRAVDLPLDRLAFTPDGA